MINKWVSGINSISIKNIKEDVSNFKCISLRNQTAHVKYIKNNLLSECPDGKFGIKCDIYYNRLQEVGIKFNETKICQENRCFCFRPYGGLNCKIPCTVTFNVTDIKDTSIKYTISNTTKNQNFSEVITYKVSNALVNHKNFSCVNMNFRNLLWLDIKLVPFANSTLNNL